MLQQVLLLYREEEGKGRGIGPQDSVGLVGVYRSEVSRSQDGRECPGWSRLPPAHPFHKTSRIRRAFTTRRSMG